MGKVLGSNSEVQNNITFLYYLSLWYGPLENYSLTLMWVDYLETRCAFCFPLQMKINKIHHKNIASHKYLVLYGDIVLLGKRSTEINSQKKKKKRERLKVGGGKEGKQQEKNNYH